MMTGSERWSASILGTCSPIEMCRNVMSTIASTDARPCDEIHTASCGTIRLKGPSNNRAKVSSPSQPSNRLATVMPSWAAEINRFGSAWARITMRAVRLPAAASCSMRVRAHADQCELGRNKEAVGENQKQNDEDARQRRQIHECQSSGPDREGALPSSASCSGVSSSGRRSRVRSRAWRRRQAATCGVVAREQNVWHALAAVLGGPRVLRVLEQPRSV